MSFLSPIFLASLPLIAVPLVIHLLSRRQQRKISWGAMRFLVAAATRRRRLWKITDLLLLLLRTAVFLFFILALARPLLPTTWLGGDLPREVILVLDQSLSMSRRAGEGTLLDQELRAADEWLKELRPRDGVRVLLAGERPNWLTTDLVPANAQGLTTLRAQMALVKTTLGGADLVAAIREALELEIPPDKSARLIAVLTDGRRYGWRTDERPLWSALQTRLEKAGLPTTVNVRVLPDPSPRKYNLAVEKIDSARAFVAVNQPLTFTAFVQNLGPEASPATLLSWRVGDRAMGVATISELAPGAGTTVTLSQSFPEAGLYRLSCQLDAADDLAADNDAYYLVEAKERLPILVVEDTAYTDPFQTDTGFFLAALGIRHRDEAASGWQSVFEPKLITSAALAATDLAHYRAIVLANVPRIPEAVVEKLTRYVEAGGGLWLALGDQTDRAFFNESLHRKGTGLVPAKLGEPVGDANDHEKFFSVRTTSEVHPATALLSDLQRLDLDRARIFRRHQFTASNSKDVSTLLQVEDGSPVVMERKLGRGRVIVQAIPLGAAWSSLPLCQAYVAMLHEWLWYLAEPTLPKRNLVVGEGISEIMAPAFSPVAELILPDAQRVTLHPSLSAAGATFRYASTRLPGECLLEIRTNNVVAVRSEFRVQRNGAESDLTPLSTEESALVQKTPGFQMGDHLPAIAQIDKAQPPRRALEGWLLTALACVLLAEIALAGWSMRRRHVRVEKISMEPVH